jgi:hypothetical protein
MRPKFELRQLKIPRYLHGTSWVPRIVRVDVEYRVSGQLKIPRYLHGTSWVQRIVRVDVEYHVSIVCPVS